MFYIYNVFSFREQVVYIDLKAFKIVEHETAKSSLLLLDLKNLLAISFFLIHMVQKSGLS